MLLFYSSEFPQPESVHGFPLPSSHPPVIGSMPLFNSAVQFL
nr:MAG TPA: hypothetical protein [Caudoviricetes sp.]